MLPVRPMALQWTAWAAGDLLTVIVYCRPPLNTHGQTAAVHVSLLHETLPGSRHGNINVVMFTFPNYVPFQESRKM